MSQTDPIVDEMSLPVPFAQAQRIVRTRFWWKVRALLGRVPFMEDLVAAYYCATDASTPARVKAVLTGAIAYFILPVDAIPDVFAGIGFTDDASVIAAAIAMVGSHITSAHRCAAKRALMRAER